MLVPVLEKTCFYVHVNRFFKELENAEVECHHFEHLLSQLR